MPINDLASRRAHAPNNRWSISIMQLSACTPMPIPSPVMNRGLVSTKREKLRATTPRLLVSLMGRLPPPPPTKAHIQYYAKLAKQEEEAYSSADHFHFEATPAP